MAEPPIDCRIGRPCPDIIRDVWPDPDGDLRPMVGAMGYREPADPRIPAPAAEASIKGSLAVGAVG